MEEVEEDLGAIGCDGVGFAEECGLLFRIVRLCRGGDAGGDEEGLLRSSGREVCGGEEREFAAAEAGCGTVELAGGADAESIGCERVAGDSCECGSRLGLFRVLLGFGETDGST